MRVVPALVAVALVTGVACGADDSSSETPRGTAIRTIAPETTVAGSTTEPLETAYATLPPVTATPPAWTPVGWQGDDVDQFGALVTEELEAIGADATVYLGAGYAVLDSGTKVPLVELAQQLTTVPQENWRTSVSDYIVGKLSSATVEEQFDYASARPSLRIKVGEPAALGVDTSKVVGKEIAPGLWAVVVFEAPDRLAYVDQELAARWGKVPDEITFEASTQTLAQADTPQVDGRYTSLTDDIFASARIVDPQTLTGALPSAGLLVVIPNTDVFLAVAVDPALDAADVHALRQQMLDGFGTRPDPASDDVYWWHDGFLEVVPFVGDQPQYPEALRAVLEPS